VAERVRGMVIPHPLVDEELLAGGDRDRGRAEQLAQVPRGLHRTRPGEAGAQRRRGERRGVQGLERRPLRPRAAQVAPAPQNLPQHQSGDAHEGGHYQNQHHGLHGAGAYSSNHSNGIVRLCPFRTAGRAGARPAGGRRPGGAAPSPRTLTPHPHARTLAPRPPVRRRLPGRPPGAIGPAFAG
jgi:hypothetical protein